MKDYMNDRGNSLVELIMVMTLLILFCMTMYTMIYAGSEAQTKIEARKEAQINTRIALAYINTKLRQNDGADQISVEKNPVNGENAIRIRYRAGEADSYDTWIFGENGGLYEFIGYPDEPPSLALSLAVIEPGESAGIDYQIEYNEAQGSIHNRLTYQYGASSETLSSVVHLRSSDGKE